MKSPVVVLVVGVRPHFIKAGPLVRAMRDKFENVVVINTGQHYSYELATVHLASAELGEARAPLEVGSGSPASQVGMGIIRLERELREVRPQLVVVIGDANSSLMGALAASQLGIPVCHIEAGVRKTIGDWTIEEVNRRLIDSVARLGLTPTRTKQRAYEAVISESSGQVVRFMGDPLLDSTMECAGVATSDGLLEWAASQARDGSILATIHRAEHLNNPQVLATIVSGITRLRKTVNLVLHPNTERHLKELNLLEQLEASPSIVVRGACTHNELIKRLAAAGAVITDSSGVQRESYFLGRPCCILRDATEYDETIGPKSARIVPPESDTLLEAVDDLFGQVFVPDLDEFGGGRASVVASAEIRSVLKKYSVEIGR